MTNLCVYLTIILPALAAVTCATRRRWGCMALCVLATLAIGFGWWVMWELSGTT